MEIRQLNAKEIETLQYLADGKCQPDVARICDVSLTTIRVRVRTSVRKLDAENCTHAVALALRQGIIS